ncbi:MAG: hypothetical protein GXO48_06330 [Chlorobi bacterium]|nr:hypothetical protein [Chlorobiota bacterium]
MLKDIDFPIGRDVEVFAVEIEERGDGRWWKVFIHNKGDKPLKNVLISSVAYDEFGRRKTQIFRYHIDLLESREYAPLDILTPQLQSLLNEYFISYWQEGVLYERRLTFPSHHFLKDNEVDIPVLGIKGIFAI